MTIEKVTVKNGSGKFVAISFCFPKDLIAKRDEETGEVKPVKAASFLAELPEGFNGMTVLAYKQAAIKGGQNYAKAELLKVYPTADSKKEKEESQTDYNERMEQAALGRFAPLIDCATAWHTLLAEAETEGMALVDKVPGVPNGGSAKVWKANAQEAEAKLAKLMAEFEAMKAKMEGES